MAIFIILFLLFNGIAHADDMLNSGGIFNKGLLVCDGSGANCVKAKQVNSVGGLTNNNDGSVQLLSSGSSASPGGGLNAVQYNSPIGTFAGNESKFFFNGTNVGVGTFLPLALLDINSSAAQDLFRVDDSAGTDTTPFIIDQTGNVGIGTATPLAVLSVSSTANQTLFRVDDNGNGDLSPFIIDQNGNVGIGTVNTERDALLVMSGNVGIGTWVPSTKLDVAGTIVTTGFRLSTSPITGGLLVSDSTGLGTWMAASTLPITSSQWTTQNTTDVSLAGGNVGIGTTRTTTAALTVMNGNVGIGTWIPSALLTVGTGANPVSMMSNGTISNLGNISGATLSNASLGFSNNGNAFLQNASNGISSRLIVIGGGNASSNLELRAANNVGIGTEFIKFTVGSSGATEAMRITGGSSPNVGIGTAIPASTLDVNGSIRSANGTPGQGACWKTDKTLGQCTSVIGVGGACTCS